MAQLQQMGEHWHQKLWYGSGPWDGDQFLNLYHNPLRDEIELRYEVPNQKPELVFQIPLADFDIDKLCASLAKADNRKTSVEEKMAAVDAQNEKVEVERQKLQQENHDAFTEKMRWAVRKDTGQHIAPLVVPSRP